MILILLLIFTASSVSSLLCPYPLPSHIEPCICELDDQFRMSLTCDFEHDFASEDFDRIVSAFDYNNNIFNFKIDLHHDKYNTRHFLGQLNKNNVGQLNVTHFIMQNVKIQYHFIEEGAFQGSYGSIETIHIYSGIANINIDDNGFNLDDVLFGAGPTLQSLKLSYMKYMSSSSFLTSTMLTEIVLVDSSFYFIPNNTFSGEFLPNLVTIEFNRIVGHNTNTTIETNAFKNLMNLTSLKMTELQPIEKIERNAFNNLPKVNSIDFTESTINGIEEDSFVNFLSLETFDLNSVLSSNVKNLPKIFTNSPLLTSIAITHSHIENIAEDFFVGTPNLKTIDFRSNRYLDNLVVQDLSKLTDIELYSSYDYTLDLVILRNLSSFKRFDPDSSAEITLITLSEMENLETVFIYDNKLETITMDMMPNLQTLTLSKNKLLTHIGLTTSLHGLLHPNIRISLRDTNVRTLDEVTFRPLIERLDGNSESRGEIDMANVELDCGCDVKWLVVDIGRTDFFTNAYCTENGMSLSEVDPILLEMMCPPDV